jgi:hypothetical protein
VGLLLLYSSSSLESYDFVKHNLPKPELLTDMFAIVVEMNNSDKKVNAVGDEG